VYQRKRTEVGVGEEVMVESQVDSHTKRRMKSPNISVRDRYVIPLQRSDLNSKKKSDSIVEMYCTRI
jgi:hypothetical protein